MSGIVRLAGPDDDVIDVARAAASTIAADREAASELFPQLRKLHDGRRKLLALRLAPAADSPPGRTHASTASRVWSVVWGTLLTVGLTAALVAAVQLGPPGRRNAHLSAEVALAIAGPTAVIALAVVLALPVPRPPAAYYGSVMVLILAIVTAGILGYRLAAGAADTRELTSEQVAFWVPVVAVIVVELLLVAWRLHVARRRTEPPMGRSRADAARAIRDESRRLSGAARRLARSESGELTDATGTTWGRRLDELAAAGIDAKTIGQARGMQPRAWLVWTFYDGDIPVDEVLRRN